jgi:hypothetical protein
MYFSGFGDSSETNEETELLYGSYPKKMLYCPANNGYYTATNDASCEIKFTVPLGERSNLGDVWVEFPITDSSLIGVDDQPPQYYWGNGSLLPNVNANNYIIQDGIYIPSQEKILYLVRSKSGTEPAYLVYYKISIPHLDPKGHQQEIDVRTELGNHPNDAKAEFKPLPITCSENEMRRFNHG